jgi:flagellar protein FliO/FliZ
MVVAFIVVFGLLALALWVLRRFGGERLNNSGARGRQPRLAVVDSAGVDGRRRLLLIRRDNVEHLVMIGGPTDVLIEPNIVRAAGAAREVPASRISGGETLPRPVPLNDGTMWPLQPEPAARIEPSLRPEAPARPARAVPSASEESPDRSEPNIPSPPPPALRERRIRPEALTGVPEEQSRTPLPSENERSVPPPRPARSTTASNRKWPVYWDGQAKLEAEASAPLTIIRCGKCAPGAHVVPVPRARASQLAALRAA